LVTTLDIGLGLNHDSAICMGRFDLEMKNVSRRLRSSASTVLTATSQVNGRLGVTLNLVHNLSLASGLSKTTFMVKINGGLG